MIVAAPSVSSPLEIERLPVRFGADQRLVITRSFFPGGEQRARNVVERVLQLTEVQVENLLDQVLAEFQHRHEDIVHDFDDHFGRAYLLLNGGRQALPLESLTVARRRLIGSYFTMEYSLAAAALFNPSIIAHPNQNHVPEGGLRFILSLRATGEGHISSIVFRTGVIEADGSVRMDPPSAISRQLRRILDQQYDRALFRRKLREMQQHEKVTEAVLGRLPDAFTFQQLEHACQQAQQAASVPLPEGALETVRWLAKENYELRIPQDVHISQVVIFPQSDNDQRGIEDLRMVAFREEDGSTVYYGTYTAFNGASILPQLMETKDLHRLSVHTLNGRCAQNKGMALFPRRLGGRYCMCGRVDGENLYLMYSSELHFWESAQLLRTPRHPWELMQMGNCGSPIETPAGWLLLTHGVGPMRKYCIGAMLLDLDDPSQVIGHLDQPLLVPSEDEREGYVPNVVYTCGALVHGPYLFVPYAMSDSSTGMVRMRLDALLERFAG